MSFLGLKGKRILVFGVANRRSVAYVAAKTLRDEGAEAIFVVQTEEFRAEAAKLFPGAKIHICDVAATGALAALAVEISAAGVGPLDGLLHSIAFANYQDGPKPFHETTRADFLQAIEISAFSLVEAAAALKPLFSPDAAVVTVSISSLLVTAETYGLMSPVKAALEGMVRHLAKSFSRDTRVRFNAVGAGPLRTRSSAGIPGYLDNYLYAERMTLRKEALATQEVADVIVFLLSPRSSGINGTTVTVDAGMGLNFFDADLVKSALRPDPASPKA